MEKDPKKLNPLDAGIKTYPGQSNGDYVAPLTRDLLPAIFQTDINKKVLSAIAEDLFQPSAMEDLNFSVGRNTSKTLVKDFLPHPTARRQLEPGLLVYKNSGPDTLSSDQIAEAWDINNRVNETPVPVSVLDLPMDPDKFVNWTDYYWVEQGMPVIYIAASATESFNVQNDIIRSTYYTTIPQKNGKSLELKNGMRIAFQVDSIAKDISADLTAILKSNGLMVQPLDVELTGYDNTRIKVTVNGVAKAYGIDYQLLGNSIHWISGSPAMNANVSIVFVNYYLNDSAQPAERRWQVAGVGSTNGIQLLGRTHQYTNTVYSVASQTLWDQTSVPWDNTEWDGAIRGINQKHYVLEEVGSENRNTNSRINVWYHKDTIQAVANFLGITFATIAGESSKALRPIVEFDNKLELYNHGLTYCAWPNLVVDTVKLLPADLVHIPLKTVNSLNLDHQYVSAMTALDYQIDLVVNVKYKGKIKTAINKERTSNSDYLAILQSSKNIIYSIKTNNIVWANGHAPADIFTAEQLKDVVIEINYRIEGVYLKDLRILWTADGAYKNSIINLVANATQIGAFYTELPVDGSAVVVDTPYASNKYYLQEFHWINGIATTAQYRKLLTQLPRFEIYDADQVKLSTNPVRPLIINTTIIEPVEGDTYDAESGYTLKFLPSQFNALSDGNANKNAMSDIVYKQTLHTQSYYDENRTAKSIRSPYSFRRTSGKNAFNELSTGYRRAWFRLRSWAHRIVESVDNSVVPLDASMWPVYQWAIKISNNSLTVCYASQDYAEVVDNSAVAAIGEPVNFKLYGVESANLAVVTNNLKESFTVPIVDNTLSFVVPPNAGNLLKVRFGIRKFNIRIIDVKHDPRNVRVTLNGLPAEYSFNITRNSDNSVAALSMNVIGTGKLEFSHQGHNVTGDSISAIPGIAFNPAQDLNIGEFTVGRMIGSMNKHIRANKVSDTQSWIDCPQKLSMDGALMVDYSSIRAAWATTKLAPAIQDVAISRSLSSWRWYRKFVAKVESNYNLLNLSDVKASLDRILEEMLLGITYSSPDAVTGMAFSTNAMSSSSTVYNGQGLQFSINTLGENMYTGLYGNDHVYVYVNEKLLIRDTDYTVDYNSRKVILTLAPVTRATVDVYYSSESAVYTGIPSSPAKLGLSGLYFPKVVTETWGTTSKLYIQRHDGSKIGIFGIDVSDVRNNILLELEMRIYNACVHKVGNPIRQRRFRNYQELDVLDAQSRAQVAWYALNNIDYRDRSDYNSQDAWTWNYNGQSWRAIYIKLFGTCQLHEAPWEALDYDNKPVWWDANYSWIDGKKRTALERALRLGIISQPDLPLSVNPALARTFNIYPVTQRGTLMNPSEWGYITPSAEVAQQPWEIGAIGPAENAWRRSIAGQWAGIMHSLDDYSLVSEFVDSGIDPFAPTVTSNSPTQLGNNTFAPGGFVQSRPTVGIGAMLFEAYREFNLPGEAPLNDLMAISVRPEFVLGGFSDGAMSLKMYYTKYQNGSYIPNEDYFMTLSNGVAVDQLRYTAVRVEKADSGFRVYGFDPSHRYFKVYTPTATALGTGFTSGRQIVATSHGDFVQYLAWNTVDTIVPYGTYISNKQDLFTFMLGLGEYQTANGLVLDQLNSRGTIADWKQASLDAFTWIDQNWGTDHFCIVGAVTPSGLKFKHEIGTLERLDADLGRTGKILFGNRRSALSSELLITRDYEPNTDMIMPVTGEQILFAELQTRNYDHIVHVNTTTKFGDLIVDLQTGNRLDVLDISARRTTQWSGRPHARGVILQNDGLLPGFDSLANDVLASHFPENNAFDSYKSTIGRADVVPVKSTVITELIQNKAQAHAYQQGLQSSAGTNLAINALFRDSNIDIAGNAQDVNVNEQWLFGTGEFGNLSNQKIWEFELRLEDLKSNRQIVRLSNDLVDISSDSVIDLTLTDPRWVTKPNKPFTFGKLNRATQTSLQQTQNWLPSAGVANIFDVDIQRRDLASVTIADFKAIDQTTKPINLENVSYRQTLTTKDIFTTTGYSRYVSYKPGDLAWDGGVLYRAIENTVGGSTSAFDSAKFTPVDVDTRLLPTIWVTDYAFSVADKKGVKYRGAWAENVSYNIGDIVTRNGVYYTCELTHVSTTSFVQNRLDTLSIVNGGEGYTTGSTITFTSDSGTGATATVLAVVNGKIKAIAVDNSGVSYSTTQTRLTVNGAVVPNFNYQINYKEISQIDSIVSGVVTKVKPVNSSAAHFTIGNNYNDSTVIVTAIGTGTGLTVTPVIFDQINAGKFAVIYDEIDTFTIEGGTGYQTGDILRAVNIDASTDATLRVSAVTSNTPASGTAFVSDTVLSSISITQGSGYVGLPTITLSAPQGQAAVAEVKNSAGQVTTPAVPAIPAIPATFAVYKRSGAISVVITNAGSGYMTAPTVTISAPNSPTGIVTALTVQNPGQSYQANRQHTLSGGSGTGATITVSTLKNQTTTTPFLENGVIAKFNIVTQGQGYGNTATIRVQRAPLVNFTPNNSSAKPEYERAYATISRGIITAVTVNTRDQGNVPYAPAISVQIIGDGTGATATPVITNNKLTGINVTNGGTQYTYAHVRIIDPNWAPDTIEIPVALDTTSAANGKVTVGKIDTISLLNSAGNAGFKLSDSIQIVDPTGSGKSATAHIAGIANGTISQVTSTFDNQTGGTGYATPPTVTVSGGTGAILTTTIKSFWTVKYSGYGWNILQTFAPMYVEEACPNALDTGLNESKVTFANPHGLKESDYFVLAGSNDGNYDRIQQVKAVVDDYNVTIAIRSTSDSIIKNMVAFKLLPVKFDSTEEFESTKHLYNWKPGMKAYIDKDDAEIQTGQQTYNFKVYQFHTDTNSQIVDTLVNNVSQDFIDTFNFYKAELIDTETQELLTTLEIYDPYKGITVDEVAQYVTYREPIDPAVYNITELGIIDEYVLQSWDSTKLGQLWWDISHVRYNEYEQGTVEQRARAWGQQAHDSEVRIYEWVSSTEMPTDNTNGILLDYSSGVGQVRYSQVEELMSGGYAITTYYYWSRAVSTLPTNIVRPYTAAAIEATLNNPDAEGVEWIAPIDTESTSASFVVANINAYLQSRNSVIVRVQQNLGPANRHTTGVLVTEGITGTEIPDYLYYRLRDSLTGYDGYRHAEPIHTFIPGATYPVGSLVSLRNLNVSLSGAADNNGVEFTATSLYSGLDMPFLPTINATRSDITQVWKNNVSNFGVFRAIRNISRQDSVSWANAKHKFAQLQAGLIKDQLEDNIFYAVTECPRRVPDSRLHSSRRYGNAYVPYPQSWFKDMQQARRTFLDSVNDKLLKINVTSKTGWDTNLRTWTPLLGKYSQGTSSNPMIYLDPEHGKSTGGLYIWDYADYVVDNYVPGNETVKITDIGQLSTYTNVTIFAVVDDLTEKYEVYKINNGAYDLVYKKNGTIQFRNTLWVMEAWDTLPWDSGNWDRDYSDMFGIILKSLRNNIFTSDEVGYFNLMFFDMVKESLVQVPTANWVSKTTYLAVDQTTLNEFNQPAIYINKKDGLIIDYLNEVKPYHSKLVDSGLSTKELQDVNVAFTESLVLNIAETRAISTESLTYQIDRLRNGTIVNTHALVKTENGNLLIVDSITYTQTLAEEG